MRLLTPARERKPKPQGMSFSFFVTAMAIAALVVGGYVAYDSTGSDAPIAGVEGRVVEGADAMEETRLGGGLNGGPTGFRVCNETASTIGVALGYDSRQGWVSEGWWNLPATTCETLSSGALASRFYYIYAIDYDRGGEWKGRHYMCTHARIFTIRGFEDCARRGLETTGFFEVDTAGQTSWTVQLTEDSLQAQ